MDVNVEADGLVEETSKIISEAISSCLRREVEKPTVGIYRPSLLSACILRQWLIYKRGLTISEEKAGYIAQVLNNLAKSARERRFNDDLKELERLMQQAKGLKQKLEEGEGVEIRPSNT